MKRYLKLILITILFTPFLDAEELFVTTDTLKLAHITLSEKYCKSIRENMRFCKSKKLSYLDYNDSELPVFLKEIRQHIAPMVKKYKEDDLKKMTLSDIKDFDADISGDWYYESDITLFAKTPGTYTLSTVSSGYSGGAHGYHNTVFDNYNIQTNKKLTLADLFLPDANQSLHNIAQAAYKRAKGLRPNQPLTDDEWFDNRFLLAENFAVTSRGLYFFYNSYEIKAYASGNTEFMLPYSNIQNIINPKGALGFALKNNHTFHASFEQKEKMAMDITAQIHPNYTVTITAHMRNLSYLNRGWFSLSFPQLKSKKNIVNIKKKGFKQVYAYPKGSKVYHNELKKAIHSSYLLVEGEDNKWKYNDPHTITLTIKLPAYENELILDLRGNFKSPKRSISLPNKYEGTKGQQGFTNYRMFIGLN